MKKKVAIYARVSTPDKQNYERQIDELVKIANEHGYDNEDIDKYPEIVSGYKKSDERVQLQQLMNKIEENKEYYGCIYTSEISRIGRNPLHTRQIIDRWSELGVPLYIQSLGQSTIQPDGTRNMTMNIILQVLMEYANEEAILFKSRSKSGRLKSAKSGKAMCGKYLPYGYTKDKDKKLIISEEESPVIIEIFELYKEGNGIKVISNILNDKKIPTRTNIISADKTINFEIPKLGREVRWSDKQIHDILRNPIYKGKRRYMGELITAPLIISEDLFDECREIMENKTTRNITTIYTYLLKDIIVCGNCGRNYFARYKPVKGGDKVYKCSSTLIKDKSCGNTGINIILIESALYSLTLNNKILLKYLHNIPSQKKSLTSIITKLKQQVTVDTNKLNFKNSETKRVLDYLIRGIINEEQFKSKQDEIQSEISSLTSKIKLSEKELRKTQSLLTKLDDFKPTIEMLINAKNDRSSLHNIFKQLYHKVIINSIDENYVLITIFFSKDVDMYVNNTAKLLLDIGGIRKNPKIYRYIGKLKLSKEPLFKNGKLITDGNSIKNEILKSPEWDIITEPELLQIS